jgi:hypothetical protein
VNPKVQPELHPDADSLNAFAEHALPEAERAEIVTHLAGCARCRDVVFLAQAAAEAEPVAPAAITRAAQPGWISGAFGRWRVALIPAAALAAVGGVVLWVQLHPAPARVETAQMVAPPPASQAVPAAAAPTPTASPEPSIAPPHPAPPAKRSRRMASGLGEVASEEVARKQAAPAMTAPQAAKRGYGAVHLDGHSASLAVQAPPPVAFSPSTETAFQSPPNPQWQSQPPMAPGAAIGALTARPPAPAPAPPNGAVVHGAAMAPSTGGPQPLDSAAASRIAMTPEPANSFALLRLARRAKLPSGRNAVSSAAMLNRLVAVDSAGSVFLSQDAGKNWEAVPAMWSGKALEVEAPPQHVYRLSTTMLSEHPEPAPADAPVPADNEEKLKASSATATAKPGAPPPAPAMLFRLVTDRHKTWVSADGKIWREQ